MQTDDLARFLVKSRDRIPIKRAFPLQERPIWEQVVLWHTYAVSESQLFTHPGRSYE